MSLISQLMTSAPPGPNTDALSAIAMSQAALLNLLPAAIYVCDADGRIVCFNRLAAELWGREPLLNNDAERFCGSLRMYRLDGGPLLHAQCPMADVLASGVPVRDQEVIVERPDGVRAVALVNIDPLKDALGSVIGAVNCFIDITKRKQAEQQQNLARAEVEALAASVVQERDSSRALLAALPAAVYTTDASGRITYYNEAACALWGCRPELGKSEFCGSWKLYWPDGKPMAHDECPMAIALQEMRPVRGETAIAERPDGTRVPFLACPTPLFDSDGKLRGAVNMLLDISEQQQLEEVKQRLAAIVASSQDAIVGKNLDGVVTSWNAGAERVFGYTAREMIGQPILVLIPEDRHNEETEILSRLRRGESVEHYETIRRRKDGTLIDVSLSVSPILDARGIIIGASKIARDITEQKKAHARQELLSKELQHRTRNTFAVIQSVVTRSFDGKRNIGEAKAAVLRRLQSLSKTYDILIVNDWSGASMAEVVSAELSPYASQIDAQGPDISLHTRAAQNFAMALHELATNASKYGALSEANGRVALRWWIVDQAPQKRFGFEWLEQGGPRVAMPRRRGFGSAVLVRVMSEHVDAEPVMDFGRDGLRYVLSGPLDRIVGTASPLKAA